MCVNSSSLVRLIIYSSDGFRPSLFVLGGHLRWFQLDCQLVELAGEAKRRLVVLVVHACAGIDSDIERLINRHEGRNGVWSGLPGNLLAVHGQDAGAALSHAG